MFPNGAGGMPGGGMLGGGGQQGAPALQLTGAGMLMPQMVIPGMGAGVDMMALSGVVSFLRGLRQCGWCGWMWGAAHEAACSACCVCVRVRAAALRDSQITHHCCALLRRLVSHPCLESHPPNDLIQHRICRASPA